MKTFTIYEVVPIMQHRTITIQAENEEDAVEKYLDGKTEFEVDTEENFEWDNAEIVGVECGWEDPE
jgi:aminoglycoside/choline kinase family phosphotransferase